MRFFPILASVSLAAFAFACSSDDSSVGGGTGGFPFETGGFFQGTGGLAATGGAVASGGFTQSGGFTSSGGSLATGGAGGAGGATGGAGGTGAAGSGGALNPDAGLDGSAGSGGTTGADSGTGGTGGVYPTPVQCADPTMKQCGGPCVKPNPANGCSLVTCVDCPAVANGVQVCNGTTCGFQCNPGYTASGNTCTTSGAADAGTKTPDNGLCAANGDCASGVCKASKCQPSRCNDGVKNGLETDVDCGGTCGACTTGELCTVNADCVDGPCVSGKCTCAPHSCNDLVGQCGASLSDHCGGTVSCGCGSGESCFQGACCDPQVACQTSCGSVSACGSTIDCGTLGCTQGQSCYQNKCCTPITQCPANACGKVSDGCGSTIDCGGCTNGRACKASTCQCDNTDTDGDGLTNCAEADDNDPWTDPAIFNGLVGATYGQCNNNPSCTTLDSNAEVDACMAKTVVETHNLSSGWGFGDTNAARCDAAYAFNANWTKTCNAQNFSVSYTGYINLKSTGTHCFDIAGASDGGCGVLFIDGSDAKPVTNGTGAQCYQLTAGPHSVRLFFDRRSPGFLATRNLGFNWEHCFGAGSNCTPSATVTQSEVRISN